MGTSIIFKGKKKYLPGIYSEIKSGIKNPPLDLSYGNVLIIDTGVGATFASGSGIAGTNTTGKDSVYSFDNIDDFRNHVKGGEFWQIAEPLFLPAGQGIQGVSKLFYVKACATAPGTITFTMTDGAVIVKTKDEGLGANGHTTTGGNLDKGYAGKFSAGVQDPAKFKFQFWVGTYKGLDALNNLPYDNITDEMAVPELLVESPELVSIQDFKDWAANDYTFNQLFIDASTISTAPGTLVVGDLTGNTGYKKAIGGTETYNSTHFDSVLTAITNIDNTFFLSDNYSANAMSLNNEKIFDFCVNAKYGKFLFVGGGQNKAKFKGGAASNSSQEIAEFFDNDNVIVVHGGSKKSVKSSPNPKITSTLYKAAVALGRICGLEPQTPATLKKINIDGEVHVLDEKELEFALQKGILVSYYDDELENFVLLQGVNSLQANSFLVNEDGTSFSIAVNRISSQLNKEIIYNAKKRFYGGEEGPNRNTITPEDIIAWLDGFLDRKVATPTDDNLITRHGNIQVTVNQDNYYVSYEFAPNFEVNKMIFTGFMLDK